MPRRPNIIPSLQQLFRIPQDVKAKLDLHLFSELEGRVPKGKYQEFFVARIKEYFDWKTLDLAPYNFPSGCFVRGPKDAIELLERKLNGKPN